MVGNQKWVECIRISDQQQHFKLIPVKTSICKMFTRRRNRPTAILPQHKGKFCNHNKRLISLSTVGFDPHTMSHSASPIIRFPYHDKLLHCFNQGLPIQDTSYYLHLHFTEAGSAKSLQLSYRKDELSEIINRCNLY